MAMFFRSSNFRSNVWHPCLRRRPESHCPARADDEALERGLAAVGSGTYGIGTVQAGDGGRGGVGQRDRACMGAIAIPNADYRYGYGGVV